MEQDLEILVLRHQLRLLQRKVEHAPRLSRFEKRILAVLATRFKASVHGLRQRLEQSRLLVKPDTMLKWHRELVARKWTFRRKGKVGRPRIAAEVEALVVRLAQENAGWGVDRIYGELLKLGVALGATTVRDILARHGIPPAPERQRKGSSWRQLHAALRQPAPGLRFLHGRDSLAQDTVRLVLHRIGLTTRTPQVLALVIHGNFAVILGENQRASAEIADAVRGKLANEGVTSLLVRQCGADGVGPVLCIVFVLSRRCGRSGVVRIWRTSSRDSEFVTEVTSGVILLVLLPCYPSKAIATIEHKCSQTHSPKLSPYGEFPPARVRPNVKGVYLDANEVGARWSRRGVVPLLNTASCCRKSTFGHDSNPC